MIVSFAGEYEFLSNFFPCKIEDINFPQITYPSVEHAFQAMKTVDMKERVIISHLETPGKAKRYGHQLTLRPLWHMIRVSTMRYYVSCKFTDIKLARALVATGDVQLIEGNGWNDTFWGKVFNPTSQQWEGENNLGKILMELRSSLCTSIKPLGIGLEQ